MANVGSVPAVLHTENPLDLFNLPLTEMYLVLDVRSAEAYTEAHVSGAYNIPVCSDSTPGTEADIEAALLIISDPFEGQDPNLRKVCVYGSEASALRVVVDLIAAQGVPVRQVEGSIRKHPKLIVGLGGRGFDDWCRIYPAFVTRGTAETSHPESPLPIVHLPSHICPWGLFLGGDAQASDVHLLELLGITTIINLAVEIPNHFSGDDRLGIRYVKVDAVDDEYHDMGAAWAATLDAVKTTHAAGGKCLVHCRAGRSRSASAVAYCMVRAGAELPSALAYLRRCRPVADPNAGFIRQLEAVRAGPADEASAFAEVLPLL